MDQTPFWITAPVVILVITFGVWFHLKYQAKPKKTQPPPLPNPKYKPGKQEAPSPPDSSTILRLSVGPSPWAWAGRSHVMDGKRYRFRELPESEKLAGITTVIDEEDHVILLLDFQCYARFLDNGRALLWWADDDKDAKSIVFTDFKFSDLTSIPDPAEAARVMRNNKAKVFGLDSSKFKSFTCFREAGQYQIDSPSDWAEFEETLVLADHAPGSNGYDKMHRAVFVFDWISKKITVLPQDWFNNGNYDFGYQWIARVARKTSGVIIGEGVRLGAFELDESGRNLKRWLSKNEGHSIQ